MQCINALDSATVQRIPPPTKANRMCADIKQTQVRRACPPTFLHADAQQQLVLAALSSVLCAAQTDTGTRSREEIQCCKVGVCL